MGGGGTMRAAAKVAGYTVANHGRRVFNSDHHTPPVVSNSIRSAHPLDDLKLVSSSQTVHHNSQPLSEIDEWVFPGFEEEEGVVPRVVFPGRTPTFQEAKEATSELADALEKAYLSSPKTVGQDDLSIVDSSSLSNSQVVENKACVTSEIVGRPSAPNQAIQAFKLLNESSMAQTVVASIACDQNVWNAVLKNPQLQEFLLSQKTPEHGGLADVEDESSVKSSVSSSGYSNYETSTAFMAMDFVEKIKRTLVDMMSKVSSIFQSSFGGYKVFTNSDGTAKVSADTVMEGSFMGLAVMAIMVILLKRD